MDPKIQKTNAFLRLIWQLLTTLNSCKKSEIPKAEQDWLFIFRYNFCAESYTQKGFYPPPPKKKIEQKKLTITSITFNIL